jgi:phage shock protein A
MVSQVENHDAIVGAAITEVVNAEAKARVRFAMLKRDTEKLRAREQTASQAIVTWRERALQARTTDEHKALECVRRLKRAEAEHKTLVEQVAAQAEIETQLESDLRLIATRLDDLRRRKNTLRTRDSRAEALRASQLDDSGMLGELDDVLERWEIRVTAAEVHTDRSTGPTDPLEAEFLAAEDENALRLALAELVSADENVP